MVCATVGCIFLFPDKSFPTNSLFNKIHICYKCHQISNAVIDFLTHLMQNFFQTYVKSNHNQISLTGNGIIKYLVLIQYNSKTPFYIPQGLFSVEINDKVSNEA